MRFSRLFRYYLLGILCLSCFGWGIAAAQYGVFPWKIIHPLGRQIAAYVRGGEDDDTNVWEKLKNDLELSPERLIRSYRAKNAPAFREVPVDGLNDRRDRPRLWTSPTAANSYRVVVGAFDFENAMWGAVLLDPSGRIAHRWYMDTAIAGLSDLPDTLKILYGTAFFPDGSAIFTMQGKGGGIVKIDACSRVEWTKKGLFHHVISPTEDFAAFWTFEGRLEALHPTLVLVDANSGKTIREIDMAAVEKANSGTFIFDLQVAQLPNNVTHPNDIDPLPKSLAAAYPDFEPGDLLLSYRTNNLIFALDPDTLRIKWWYVGAADSQHDPDWHRNGRITVFGNNTRSERRNETAHSSIVSIDPTANTHRTVIDGKRYNFYSSYNGHHQFTDYGSVVVTSSTQGRVFEVDLESGKTLFEFINAYDWTEGRTLHLAEAFAVDKAQGDRWAARKCAKEAS